MKNKIFKMSLEIEVTAETPLEAAKIVQDMLQEQGSNWQFYVQEENKKEIFSIDLNEDDSDAVMEISKYTPSIENK